MSFPDIFLFTGCSRFIRVLEWCLHLCSDLFYFAILVPSLGIVCWLSVVLFWAVCGSLGHWVGVGRTEFLGDIVTYSPWFSSWPYEWLCVGLPGLVVCSMWRLVGLAGLWCWWVFVVLVLLWPEGLSCLLAWD